jgi:hypothetical protein
MEADDEDSHTNDDDAKDVKSKVKSAVCHNDKQQT